MASTVNITIDQGSAFEWVFALQQTHLQLSAGSTVKAALREEYFAGNTVLFTSELDGSNVSISMTSAQTANLNPGTWVYDVLVIDTSNNVTRAVQGLARVKPQVTTFP